MDFGELLEEWERLSSRPGGLDKAVEAERRALDDQAQAREDKAAAFWNEGGSGREAQSARRSMETWLASHGVEDKDSRREESSSSVEEARRLSALRPGARIDLHGKTVAEAEYALGIFLEDAARKGIEKVLVITGKGNHSASGGVLAKAMRTFLEANPRAGRFGTADRADGGAGALWVVVRRFISPGR